MSRRRKTDIVKVLPILSPVLGEELALAIIEHRDEIIRMPLTERAAHLQVREYLKTGNPGEAAEMQIFRGWRAIAAAWYFEAKRREQRPEPRRTLADATRDPERHFGDADWPRHPLGH